MIYSFGSCGAFDRVGPNSNPSVRWALIFFLRKLNKQNFIRPVINFRASTKHKNTKPLEPNFPLTFTLKREISQMVDLRSVLEWTRLLLKRRKCTTSSETD